MNKTRHDPSSATHLQSQTLDLASARVLDGQTVALVGQFGFRDLWAKLVQGWVIKRGGMIVRPQDQPELLVTGEGRGGRAPGDVARIQKSHPAVKILTMAEFLQRVIPTADEWLADIRKRKWEDTDWEEFDQTLRLSVMRLDSRGMDFRGQDLHGAKLELVNLDGADFRFCKLQYAHLPALKGARFDDAALPHAYLNHLEDCSFQRAILEKAWLFLRQSRSIYRCDFRRATMPRARLERGICQDCDFMEAELVEAEVSHSTFSHCNFSKANLAHLHAHQAKFTEGNFQYAQLPGADLRGAQLMQADMRHANLRGAILSEANLSGALVEGADFTDAVLTNSHLDQVDFSRALGFVAPSPRTLGPRLLEFAQAASGCVSFVTSAEVELEPGEFIQLELRGCDNHAFARSEFQRNDRHRYDQISAPTFVEGMHNLAERWRNAKLQLHTVTARGSRSVRGQKLQALALAAWAEVFHVNAANNTLKEQKEAQRQESLLKRDRLLAELRIKGPDAWNALPRGERDRLDLRGADLSQTSLAGISLGDKDLQGINLRNACLKEAELWTAKLQRADLSGADLSGADLSHANLEKALLVGSRLNHAKLARARLQGADLTNAHLENVTMEGAQFDERTLFPDGFIPLESMVWKGEGERPGVKPVAVAAAGTLDFETFLQHLNDLVERSRMEKVSAMLKAEKFQLFSEVKDDAVIGVVKSQSSHDLVYSCRLASDGAFSCCTQNLRPCGGLRGALCKHLLVLIVGLARAGLLDPATVNNWIEFSRVKKPAIDEELMSATFLRYKGAEAGEIDWRPTETIPEDFYAM